MTRTLQSLYTMLLNPLCDFIELGITAYSAGVSDAVAITDLPTLYFQCLGLGIPVNSMWYFATTFFSQTIRLRQLDIFETRLGRH